MPARRTKSIMHGSAEDTRVYHREHRSKKGRKKFKFGEHKSPLYLIKLKELEESYGGNA